MEERDMVQQYQEAYTLAEVAEILGVSHTCVRAMVSNNQLACIKTTPRKWRITRPALNDYLERMVIGEDKPKKRRW